MRPAIAYRTTECNYCHESIIKGSDRLDDVVSIRNKEVKFYRRLHYHPACYTTKANKWFEDNRDKPRTHAHGGGRPPLDLTPDEKEARHKLLIKLSNLFAYYLPKLDLQTPVDELTFQSLKVMLNFQQRFRQYASDLVPLGGLPPKYRDMQLPDISDALVAVSEPLKLND